MQSLNHWTTEEVTSFIYKTIYIELGASLTAQSVKNACSAEDPGLIPGLERSPGEGNGNPLWYSYLENPMNRGSWKATVYGVERVGHHLATKPPPTL